MANILNTLNLIQVKGGVNIKQGDSSSILEYELGYTNASNMMVDPMLDGKAANINLYNKLKNTKWNKTSVVKGNRVSFTIDEALELGVYMLDIEVDGHVFPSDGESRIRIHEGYESYMDGRSAVVAVATAKNIANEAIRLAVLDKVDKFKGEKGDKGKKGDKGDKGDKSIVYSSTEPDDKNVVWVKNDNVRNVYRKLHIGSNLYVELGKLSNHTKEIPEGYNISFRDYENLSNLRYDFNYLRIKGHEIPIIKKEYYSLDVQTLCCKISDTDLKTIIENVAYWNQPWGENSFGAFDTFEYNTYTEQIEILKKTGEETYSTVSIYNHLTKKWEKLSEDGKDGVNGKDCEVVDNLESEDGDKALSARQGKILNKKYDELFYDVDNGKDLIAKAIVDKKGQADKDDSFTDLASKIGEIKTGWEPGHKFSPYELKAEYGDYSYGDIYPLVENVDDVTPVYYTDDLYFITKEGKLFLHASISEVLISDKYKYLNLWEFHNNENTGMVSVDKDGFISLYWINSKLEETKIVDTMIPSTKKIEVEFTRGRRTMVVSTNDRSFIEIHHLNNGKHYISHDYDRLYINGDNVYVQKKNELVSTNYYKEVFILDVTGFNIDYVFFLNENSLTALNTDNKYELFNIENGSIRTSRMVLDFSKITKGKFFGNESYQGGCFYVFEGVVIFVGYDNKITTTYKWNYDRNSKVEVKYNFLIISHVENDVIIEERINMTTKEKNVKQYPNYDKKVKISQVRNNYSVAETEYYIVNGDFCYRTDNIEIDYFILPEFYENGGD